MIYSIYIGSQTKRNIQLIFLFIKTFKMSKINFYSSQFYLKTITSHLTEQYKFNLMILFNTWDQRV